MSAPSVPISLTPSEALVLFEWLSRWNQSKQFNIFHPSEERVLWDLTAQLERQLAEPLQADYIEKLHAARNSILEIGDAK